MDRHTPTALPRKKRAIHNHTNVLATEARMPNKDVKKSVALNAVVRPMRSLPKNNQQRQWRIYNIGNVHLHVPHPTAPNIIPPNIDDDSRPIYLSCTGAEIK